MNSAVSERRTLKTEYTYHECAPFLLTLPILSAHPQIPISTLLIAPMNGVLGMTSLLAQTDLSSEQRDMVATIETSGDTLLTTINDILDYSKIEANKLDLEKLPFHISQCIDETFLLLRARAQEKGIFLRYQIEDECPPVWVQDATRIRQILTNLVGNAVKFTNQGGIMIKVNCGEKDVEKLGLGSSHLLSFSVQDSGIGIPEDATRKLFDSFSQVDASTTRKYGGSGLGLAISRQLAELMGGKMWVKSLVGIGSTFHFTIRAEVGTAQDTESGRCAIRFDTEMAQRKPLRILLAEDTLLNQKIAKMFLQRLGYNTDIAGNGLEAIEALQRNIYDGKFIAVHLHRDHPLKVATHVFARAIVSFLLVVLMDVNMPLCDGIEATRQLQATLPASRQPRIIAMTANAMVQERDKVFQAGMHDFVPKPVRIEALMEALEKCCPIGAESLDS